MAGAAGARLDPRRPHREHRRVPDHQRQHAIGCRRRPGRGLRDRRPRRVLRQGRDQGRVPADRRLRLGARSRSREGPVARHGGAGSLLHALRRYDRAALRSCDVAQAVPEAGAPPVRRAVRRLRDRPDADRAHALQPYVHGPEVRLRRRALRLQRVRCRVGAGLRQGRAAGRRHLGPLSAVAPPDHPQQRQDPPRSARPLPQRGRGRVAAALAVRRLQHRLSQRHAVLQAAGAEPRSGLQPGVHHRRVRSAQRRRSADDRWRPRRGQARERQHRDRRELPAGRRRGGRQQDRRNGSALADRCYDRTARRSGSQ